MEGDAQQGSGGAAWEGDERLSLLWAVRCVHLWKWWGSKAEWENIETDVF